MHFVSQDSFSLMASYADKDLVQQSVFHIMIAKETQK